MNFPILGHSWPRNWEKTLRQEVSWGWRTAQERFEIPGCAMLASGSIAWSDSGMVEVPVYRVGE